MTQSIAKKAPAPTWDLDSIIPGGSGSPQFKQHRDKVRAELKETADLLAAVSEAIDDKSLPAWVKAVLSLQATIADIELVLALAGCQVAQNVKDGAAHAIEAEGDGFFAEWKKLSTKLEALSLNQSDAQWAMLTSAKELVDVKFYLDELRQIARSKMTLEKEELALELAVNGYHAWNRLYDKMAGDLRAEFLEDGQMKQLSMGQLATKMSDPDRDVRRRAFEAISGAWKTRADLAGMALNSQGGFRLSLYKSRKWDSILFEPLFQSRLNQGSLEAMFAAISARKQQLAKFIDAKKKLLGIDKYSWYDQFAPCGATDTTFTFEEAGQFVVDNVGTFSDDMASFMKMAIEKRWVEAEDRGDKAGGAFCTGFGPISQSRVFMTFGGSFENLLTLAHELGHAYHQQVITEKPFLAQSYPMPLAETASIFSETLVTDAALSKVTDRGERLALLDSKLQAAYTMFTDLHCRFLFDRKFYAERANGVVQTERLNELMIEAQREAFGGMLDERGYHPLFWASKLHFYITGAPFYNFPYIFGFLFSGGVYDVARREGKSFAPKYRQLLVDTGSMTCEDVAKKHLGADLTKPDFWNAAVERSLADIDEFVKLAAEG